MEVNEAVEIIRSIIPYKYNVPPKKIDEAKRTIIEAIKDTRYVLMKWNPVKVREATDEEKKYYYGENVKMLDGVLPEDEEEIIIVIDDKKHERFVTHDISFFDGSEYFLDSQYDWSEVSAWMSMPEPYKEKENCNEN